jgi:tRNA (guanine-N7-)-methyltransferase
VRVVSTDARTYLPGFIPNASLHAVHVFFPDPWWKTRHRKRRVFTEAFAQQCQRILRPSGQLHVVSDVQEYFETITALVATLPELRELPPPDVNEPQHDLDYLTNFDRKYRKEGRPIYRARYQKIEAECNR